LSGRLPGGHAFALIRVRRLNRLTSHSRLLTGHVLRRRRWRLCPCAGGREQYKSDRYVRSHAEKTNPAYSGSSREQTCSGNDQLGIGKFAT
jgi:hypothetical protein